MPAFFKSSVKRDNKGGDRFLHISHVLVVAQLATVSAEVSEAKEWLAI
jgi:hypothetical protein